MKEEKRNYLKEFRYVSSFMIFIVIFGIVFTFLSLGLAFGIEFLINSESQASILGEIVLYGGTAYTYYVGYKIFLKKWNQKINTKLDTKKLNIAKLILNIIVSILIVRFIWIIWEDIVTLLNYSPEDTEQNISIIFYVYGIIIAPILEEIVFRGYILKILKKYGTYSSIILSSIIFGLFHGTFTQAIPCIFIGIVFASLTTKYKSLLPSIIVHIITNFMSFITINNEMLLTTIKVIIIVLSIVSIIYLIIINFKNIKEILKEIKLSFLLQFKSLSYILFLLYELTMIVTDALDGILHIIN